MHKESNSLAVLIPAYNEEKTIAEVISRVPKQIKGIDFIKIIVINDGSTDNTFNNANQLKVEIINNEKNEGLGFTLKKGIKITREYRYLVTIDSDLQFQPEDIPLLIKPLIEQNADITTISRFQNKSVFPEMSKIRFFLNILLAKIVSRVTNFKVTDLTCGFRGYRTEVLEKFSLTGTHSISAEIILEAIYHKSKIIEVPLKIQGEREFGKSKVTSNLFKYFMKVGIPVIIKLFNYYKVVSISYLITLVLLFTIILLLFR